MGPRAACPQASGLEQLSVSEVVSKLKNLKQETGSRMQSLFETWSAVNPVSERWKIRTGSGIEIGPVTCHHK